jgi:large subunit ribosomal protein L32
MVVRMRHTRAHSANRRSHHALTEARLSSCGNCGELHLRHRLCENCGRYRGRIVVDVAVRAERQAKRAKAKEQTAR